jgi:Cerato-platanin
MKFAIVASVLALLPSLARSVTVSYDQVYDNAGTSLATVACSDGSHGMLTRNFTTFGSLPRFPYIGGYVAIAGWNSPKCGTCHLLTYTDVASGKKKSITVLAIDSTNQGYNIAVAAMNDLTGGRAKELGKVEVTEISVNPSMCGL